MHMYITLNTYYSTATTVDYNVTKIIVTTRDYLPFKTTQMVKICDKTPPTVERMIYD